MEIMAEASEVKIDLTYAMVMRVLKLSKLQIRAIFISILQKPLPAEEDILPAEDILMLLVADMLENLVFLQPEQRTVILSGLHETASSPNECPTCLNQLVFVESRYTTWTGQTGFVDLETGEQVMTLPHPPMETIGYNLTELYRRGVLRTEKKAGFHVKSNPNSVGEPGDVWKRASDVLPG